VELISGSTLNCVFVSGQDSESYPDREKPNIHKKASFVKLGAYGLPVGFEAVFGIRDIMVLIRIRGSVPLTNGSGSNSGSDFFLQGL
jgi:hypothetical protein